MNYDFVVCGGGLSGVAAAVAAARKGLHVALIQDRPVLGGNCSSELRIAINGAAAHGNSPSVYAREGGIVEELKLALSHFGGHRDLAFFELVYAEKNIDLYLNTVIVDVKTQNDRILGVFANQLGSERKFYFSAPLFTDSTGDGTVGFLAGAEFMHGRESRAQFHEPLAPEVADDCTQGSTIMFYAHDTGKPVMFHRPSWAYDITQMPFFKNLGADKGLHRDFYPVTGGEMCGYWWVEYGGQLDTISDNEEIALELRKIAYGLWDYIKNSGEFKGMETWDLSHVNPVTGKRESRRLLGDYVLTQHDVDQKTDFYDAVAIAGWPMDVHAPKGIYDDEPATFWHYVAGSFNLPFRMMYSKNIGNLMFAGRDMSVSHVAFGSTRLACQGGVAGQTVGTAAYLCRKYDILPRAVCELHIRELQQTLLDDDQTIIGYPDSSAGKNWCAGLQITTSSTMEYANDEALGMLWLDQPYVLVLPSTKNRIDSLKIKIKNFSSDDQILALQLMSGTRKENYIPQYTIKEMNTVVPARWDDWLELNVNASNFQDDKLYILFGRNRQLRIYANHCHRLGAVTFATGEEDPLTHAEYKGSIRINRLRTQGYNYICFKDVQPEQNIYAPENLVNGFSRPYGTPNAWISKPSRGPEWVNFQFETPKRIQEIHLVFNTMLEEDNLPDNIECNIKRYAIETESEDGTIESLGDFFNYQRVARHKLKSGKIRRIKLILKETYGSKTFELFAVKFF